MCTMVAVVQEVVERIRARVVGKKRGVNLPLRFCRSYGKHFLRYLMRGC